MQEKPLKVYIICGEASGDFLGGRLMQSLRKKCPFIEFYGIGGACMKAEGLESLFPFHELSVMGLIEIIPHIPRLLRRIHQTVAHILQIKPDIVVTIDSPGFCLRVAKKLKQVKNIEIPVIHYSLPTVWAWRPERAKKCAAILRHGLALFPFEPPYFEKEGLGCTFVGHPLLEMPIGTERGEDDEFKKLFHIPSHARILCLLPGSRAAEVKNLLPIFSESLKILASRIPDLWVVIPTFDAFRPEIEAAAMQWSIPTLILSHQQQKYQAMRASCMALAASGTVSLELALAETPMVIAYKANRLTAWIVKKLIKVPYVCLVNILLKEKVVPELLQEACTADKIAHALWELYVDPSRQKNALKKIPKMLKNGESIPSDLAAETVLKVLKGGDKGGL